MEVCRSACVAPLKQFSVRASQSRVEKFVIGRMNSEQTPKGQEDCTTLLGNRFPRRLVFVEPAHIVTDIPGEQSNEVLRNL